MDDELWQIFVDGAVQGSIYWPAGQAPFYGQVYSFGGFIGPGAPTLCVCVDVRVSAHSAYFRRLNLTIIALQG